jgi:hypothetical protein
METLVINPVTVVIYFAAALKDPYDRVKGRKLVSYMQPRWVKISKLIRVPDLGGQRTFHLVFKMLALLSPTTVPDEVFVGLFKDRLPVKMRAVLNPISWIPVLWRPQQT